VARPRPRVLMLEADSLCFQVVYDVRRSIPGGWDLPMLMVAVFLLGFWAYRYHGSNDSMKDLRAMVIGLILMSIAVLGVLFFTVGSLVPYMALRVRMARGSYEELEGVVTAFRSGYAGTRLETWTLQTPNGTRTYAYSTHILAGGYDGTSATGSLLKRGIRARVYDVGGRIARLEVAC
jgi:hypothetical protein